MRRSIALLGLAVGLGISLPATAEVHYQDCRRITRQISHFEDVEQMAQDRRNYLWEEDTRRHITRLEVKRARLCPQYAAELEQRHFMKKAASDPDESDHPIEQMAARSSAKRARTISLQAERVRAAFQSAACEIKEGVLKINALGHDLPEIFDRCTNELANFGKQLKEIEGIVHKIAVIEQLNGPSYPEGKGIVDDRYSPAWNQPSKQNQESRMRK